MDIAIFTILLDQFLVYGSMSQIIRHPKIIFSNFISSKKIWYSKKYDILIFSLILCRKMREKQINKKSTLLPYWGR